MADTKEVQNHLEELKASVNSALQTVYDFKKFGDKLTAANKAAELAKVTTVPTQRQHARDCSICPAWDGS